MNLTGRPIYQKGQKPGKSAVICRASKGQTCTLQIPGVCECTSETVVGAHLRMPWLCDTSQEPDDLFIMDACASCHAVQESYYGNPDAPLGWDDILRALTQTQMRRRASGLILLEGESA